MQLTIRKAYCEDIPALEALIQNSVKNLQAAYYSREQMDGALGTVFGVDSQLIKDGTYFIAEIESKMVGCGGWSQRKTLFGGDKYQNKEDDLLDPIHEPARIRAFFVHPAWVRRGIGSKILAACEAAAIGVGFSRLELVATLAGEPLYKAHGFSNIEHFEISLPNGACLPVIRMYKQI
ncbi:GNAT family N-acetyltransferase [Nostoc sp. NMS4]|uniref:GNAT family N-acetyltransferase n=1 Tax=Nostoc sp. NMS4 TaxID=2815390 RepID=UPI0025CBEEEF|nr:GNAT family N-acetyltransferase [Nostoc sp. NMS4]MBN3926515.1 GNAT family N-acetyltransferase [Nostoc sp. NMS4]